MNRRSSDLSLEERAEFDQEMIKQIEQRSNESLLNYDLLAKRPWREKLKKILQGIALGLAVAFSLAVGSVIDTEVLHIDTSGFGNRTQPPLSVMIVLIIWVVIFALRMRWKYRK